ncbi:S41 family peptidase [Phenylobacterium sp. 20VBR1]|uniref:S41 family peptidase n=1 Tax=Phenylobacterium glaciei TaxID=2803784 RepID=A0A941D3A5_9CAUL|nr:S41 family peptidase [Phenylobacterium glaciei]MBR7620784.1 S41 family peptidase [Phenylobacterium glaciei]
MRRHLVAAGAALVLVTGLNGVTHAQTAPAAAAVAKPMDAAERRDVIEKLATALKANFLFPDIGARYAGQLRANLAAGAYEGLTDPTAFGEKVTSDLQALAKDGHLRLAPESAWNTPRPPAADIPASARASGPPGLEDARMIGDVAYLRFNQFVDEPPEPEKARAFLLAHADAKAVIIDARPHRGGGLAVMDAILPLLYAKTTHLVRMDTRAGIEDSGPLTDGPTLVRQASPPTLVSHDHVVTPDKGETRLQKVPVYYLTSRRSASAAEHLALAFKRTHRATLVGETTRGAGHYGGVLEVGDRFGAFVPVGRSYDPDTNWDWEGKGVTPNVAVPTDQALDEALKLAKAAGAHPG